MTTYSQAHCFKSVFIYIVIQYKCHHIIFSCVYFYIISNNVVIHGLYNFMIKGIFRHFDIRIFICFPREMQYYSFPKTSYEVIYATQDSIFNKTIQNLYTT